MARWSDAMKFTDIDDFRAELEGRSGCYEIGRVRSGEFFAMYIGKASCLWNRLTSYRKVNSHHEDIAELNLAAERKHLYFHVMATRDFSGTESRLIHRFEIGESGMYAFNRRAENHHLKESYNRRSVLAEPDITTSCKSNCRKQCPRKA